MRKSGYGPTYREDILRGAIRRDLEFRNKPVRYRDGTTIRQHKKENDLKYLNTWFLRGTNTSVIKVQATPGGTLASRVRSRLRGQLAPDGGTTLVVEAAGKPLTAGLKRPDPGLSKGCPFRDKCLVDDRSSCWGSKIVYKLSCNLCPASYLGTSGHSSHKRRREHQEALRLGNEAYAIVKHFKVKHQDWEHGSTDPFKFTVLRGPNIQGNLQRYLGEALEIREAVDKGHELLNSRGEWGRVQLKRLALVSD